MKLKLTATIRAIKEGHGSARLVVGVPGVINEQFIEIDVRTSEARGLLPGDKLAIDVRSMSEPEQKKHVAAERASKSGGPACND